MSNCRTVIIASEDIQSAEVFQVPLAEKPQRIVVAMSGGVDSSVAAWLLKEAGHEVIGVSLRLAPDDAHALASREGRCCSADDMTDARQVCERLGVPFYAIDARDKFKEAVFDPFVAAYRQGITPIPCLACNHQVKFGDLFHVAQSMGAVLATGHYATVVDYKGVKALARPEDSARDQTYYLYGTAPEVIERLYMPLGGLKKPFIRALAKRMGLSVSQKPDSQEICFVPDGDHAKVVEKASGPLPTGDLLHINGKKVGRHEGVHHFTIGQRRGVGVGLGERTYVVDVDAKSNQVTLGSSEALLVSKVEAGPLKNAVPLTLWPKTVEVQVRARSQPQRARFELLANGNMVFEFETPVKAVALGQAAVVYDENILLGGGILVARLDGSVPRRI